MKISEKMEIASQGAHQRAVRRKSLNVLAGAIKTFTSRAPSDIGAGAGAGREETGGSGATAITNLHQKLPRILSPGSPRNKPHTKSNFFAAPPRGFSAVLDSFSCHALQPYAIPRQRNYTTRLPPRSHFWSQEFLKEGPHVREQLQFPLLP